MRKILDQLVQRKPAQSKAPEKSEPRAHWKRSGHIYYLLDTLKLSYESHCGRVTYEKISVDSLHDLCDELVRGRQIAPRETAHVPELFSLSVCGVCWEELGTQIRTKAIPEAACLRFENIEHSASEAKFQMVDRMTDDGVTPLAHQFGFDKAIRRVNNISVDEFIQFLKKCNTHIPGHLVNKLAIRSENFDSVFTLTESHLLEQVLEQGPLLNVK